MAIVNPTKYVTVRRLERFKQKQLSQLIANTAGTKSYMVQQLLTAMADLMDKVVVADDAPAEEK